MAPESVHQKLRFARTRLVALEALIAANQLAADPDSRQQLMQEFLIHLIGAPEYLAQLINERRSLHLSAEQIAVYKVAKALEKPDPSDPLLIALKGLTANTRSSVVPDDPYSEDGLIYRGVNYRNEVVHRNINPFHFALSAGPKVAFLWIDPRDHTRGMSNRPFNADLSAMLALIEVGCRDVLTILA